MAAVSPSRYVPYGFARSHSVLVTGQSGDAIEVWIGDRTTPGALAELTRNWRALFHGPIRSKKAVLHRW
jgi:general secretion pathway protein E